MNQVQDWELQTPSGEVIYNNFYQRNVLKKINQIEGDNFVMIGKDFQGNPVEIYDLLVKKRGKPLQFELKRRA